MNYFSNTKHFSNLVLFVLNYIQLYHTNTAPQFLEDVRQFSNKTEPNVGIFYTEDTADPLGKN